MLLWLALVFAHGSAFVPLSPPHHKPTLVALYAKKKKKSKRVQKKQAAKQAAPAPPPAAPAPPKPAPPVPPRRKPMPPLPRAPVPKPPRRAPAPAPPTDDDDDAFWAAAADAASRAEAAAGATAPVAFEDASVTRERQRREPRGPPLTGEERRQRAADAADATYIDGLVADARRAHPTAAAARSTAGALRAASAAAAARATVIRRLGESSDDDDDLLGGPRTARKAPRPPGAALDELEARTTATPARRTDARAAADIADSWLAAQESSIQNDGARPPKKTPSSTLPQARDDELRAPEDDVRSFVATRLSRAKTPKTPRTRKEALVDLLVEPDLHTYRQARALVGSGLEAAFYHAARGALAAANDDATLDKNVVKRAGQVLAAARDGTLVDELRRGERDDQGHVFT